MDLRALYEATREWLSNKIRLDLTLALRLCTVAIFVALGYSLCKNWYQVRDYLSGIRYEYLCLAFGVHAAALGSAGVAWHLIIKAVTASSDFRRDAKIYYYTALAKRIPGVVWYIAGRAHLYSRQGIGKLAVMTSVLMETALVFVCGVACVLLLSPVYSYSPHNGTTWLLLLPAIPLSAIVLRPNILATLVNPFLRRFGQPQISIDLSPSWMVPICAMYGLAWLGGGLCLYLLISATHPLALSELPTVIGFATVSGLAGLLTLALPAGMGVKEVTLAALLAYYVPFPVAIVISVLFRMLTTADEVLWAVIAAALWR